LALPLALAATRLINPTAQARAPGNNNHQHYWRSVLNLLVILARARFLLSFDEPFNQTRVAYLFPHL
jgi:hypothetical protein